ncbi:MAG: hypothetical protein K5783_10955 [Nitrosopumilus sp.]|nr:hypothetical protein [Nitrosopumilus sp.]
MIYLMKKICLFALASVLVLIISYDGAFATSEITLDVDKTKFEPTSRIFVTGTIDPGIQFYEPVEIVMYDPNGNAIIHIQSTINENNQFSALITGPLGSFDSGVYGIVATHTSTNDIATVVIEIDEFKADIRNMIMDPLEQTIAGILPNNVICDENLILMETESAESAACVTASTAIVLEDRKWGKIL